MPEYLAPGVYVEETSFRAKSIEGVSTTTTGFIGPARSGPIDLEPDILTSLGEFERIYGDRQQLVFTDDQNRSQTLHNFLWHAVRAFFDEGGKRLYVARVFKPLQGTYPPAEFGPFNPATTAYNDGHARGSVPETGGGQALQVRARFPGAAGNMRVRFTLRLGQDVLSADPATNRARVSSLVDGDVIWIGDIVSPITSPAEAGFFTARFDRERQRWQFTRPDSPEVTLTLDDLHPNAGSSIRLVNVTVTVLPVDPNGFSAVWENLPLDPGHQREGAPDSLTARFDQRPSNLAQARSLPIVLTRGAQVATGLDVLTAFLTANTGLRSALNNQASTDARVRASSTDRARSVEVPLRGGNDGQRPTAAEYEGTADEDKSTKTGLKTFEDVEDISIVAAPGSTFGLEDGYRSQAATIVNLLIGHAERMRYRIAVLDSGNEQSIAQVRAMRAKIDSKYAALYYPWVRVLDPVTQTEIHLPPSGFVAGIYARNDILRAVYKAPANEVVTLAIGFELLLNKSQQDVLNPEGVNCFRFFEGRGFRLWGARTISSDPEWKYVNLRRYFAYLERSIDKGTQWAVFEPNGDALWGNVRRTIEDFLLNEWQSGALLGDKPEKAYFVRCDRSTMTQNDIDNGRLICLIGVAPLRPAEYVIFRIGQWTADRKG